MLHSTSFSAPRRCEFAIGFLAICSMLMPMCGCTSTYDRLPRDGDVEQLWKEVELARQMPERISRAKVHLENGESVAIELRESGNPESSSAMVMLHGVMSDAQVYRHLRGRLAQRHRVITVDFPGSGNSDAPDARELGPGAYSPLWLSKCTLLAVRQHLQKTLPAGRITLVGHSLGGMVILRMLSTPEIRRDFADILETVDGVVLFTPIDVALEKDQPLFRSLRTVSGMEIAIADLLGILEQRVAEGTLASVVDPAVATRDEADRVLAILRDPARRSALKAMIRRAVPQQRNSPHWPRIEELVRSYCRINKPCLIIWGGRDELFPESMGHKLVNQIPGAKLRVIVNGKHCLPVEHPRLCTRIIHEFLAETIGSERFDYYPPAGAAILANSAIGTGAADEAVTPYHTEVP